MFYLVNVELKAHGPHPRPVLHRTCSIKVSTQHPRPVLYRTCYYVVEEVSATVVAEEGQHVSALDILPERRADALSEISEILVGSATLGMRPDSCSPATAR